MLDHNSSFESKPQAKRSRIIRAVSLSFEEDQFINLRGLSRTSLLRKAVNELKEREKENGDVKLLKEGNTLKLEKIRRLNEFLDTKDLRDEWFDFEDHYEDKKADKVLSELKVVQNA